MPQMTGELRRMNRYFCGNSQTRPERLRHRVERQAYEPEICDLKIDSIRAISTLTGLVGGVGDACDSIGCALRLCSCEHSGPSSL